MQRQYKYYSDRPGKWHEKTASSKVTEVRQRKLVSREIILNAEMKLAKLIKPNFTKFDDFSSTERAFFLSVKKRICIKNDQISDDKIKDAF